MPVMSQAAQRRTFAEYISTAQLRIAAIFDRFATRHTKEVIERTVVYLAAWGFLLHLALIFLTHTLRLLPFLDPLIGPNYLAAIYTPFSLILCYEVLMLVLTIPASTTRALGTQFEIISLMTLRNVFKDLAHFESLNEIEHQIEPFVAVIIDMGGALLLFLLVAIFSRVTSRRTPHEQGWETSTPDLQQFIARKKIIALTLSLLFFALLVTSLVEWLFASYQVVAIGAPQPPTITTVVLTDLFSVLIFSDVLILILSLLLSDRYQLVFRNASFVVATIMLRVSLAAAKPFDVLIALGATLFGILVLLIYQYYVRIIVTKEPPRFADAEHDGDNRIMKDAIERDGRESPARDDG